MLNPRRTPILFATHTTDQVHHKDHFGFTSPRIFCWGFTSILESVPDLMIETRLQPQTPNTSVVFGSWTP